MKRTREELDARLKELRDQERALRARHLTIRPVWIRAGTVANDREPKSNVISVAFGLDPRRAYDLYCAASEIDEDPACFDRAEEMYREAFRRDPTLAIALTNLGNIRFRRADENEAVALYRQAIALDPRQPEAHYNLGYALLERGEARAAIEELTSAIACAPHFADAHWNLAMALTQLGQHAKAKHYWHIYLDLEPNGTWADMARQYLYGNARRQQ